MDSVTQGAEGCKALGGEERKVACSFFVAAVPFARQAAQARWRYWGAKSPIVPLCKRRSIVYNMKMG